MLIIIMINGILKKIGDAGMQSFLCLLMVQLLNGLHNLKFKLLGVTERLLSDRLNFIDEKNGL
ncbi:hypothetical protein D3C73_825110 [compost metagenome]